MTNIPDELQLANVADLARDDDWNWDLLQNWLPRDILRIVPPTSHVGPDVRVCVGDVVSFTVSNAYKMLDEGNATQHLEIWRKIWKLQVPERVKTFIWKMQHDGILTNKKKHRMNLGSAMCERCGNIIEDSLHVLRDCPKAVNLWQAVVCTNKTDIFFAGDLETWIQLNIQSNMGRNVRDSWDVFWAYACHNLWIWHNKETHDENFQRPNCMKTHIMHNVWEYIDAIANAKVISTNRKILEIKWEPPPPSWVKINVDGASNVDGNSGCGGIVRGAKGEWLGGFSKDIGICNAYAAELWSVYEGMQFVHRLDFCKVIVEMDSQQVIKDINNKGLRNTMGKPLIARIQKLRSQEVVLHHCYREANKCADALAKHGISLQEKHIQFDTCPKFIRELLDSDLFGEPTPRLIFV